MHTKGKVLLLGIVSLLLSCGGGGGDSPILAPPPVDQVMGGFWVGELTFDTTATSEEFVGLVADDGRFRFLSVDSMTHFAGMLQIDISNVTGDGLGFADQGGPWRDGSMIVAVTLDADLLERNSFSGTWTAASGDSGSFDFFYDAEYERNSSLALLEGIWSVYDDTGNATATFTIEANGQFNGQNDLGCQSAGQFSIIDANFNLYQVDSTISGCPIAGDYNGLAILGDLFAQNDAIVLTINNDQRGIVLGLEKEP